MFIGNLSPKKIDEIKNGYLREKMEAILRFPHNFIIDGKENTGKKTLIRAYLCSYWCREKINFRVYEERINKNLVGKIKVANGIIEVNLVHFNVHDKLVLLHLVEPFLRIKPQNEKPRFVIIPDMDKITDSASKMLKTFVEKYYRWNIFIGTVETSNPLPVSLRSNFDFIRMPFMEDIELVELVEKYKDLEENVEKKERTENLLKDKKMMMKMINYVRFPDGNLNYSSFFYVFTNYLVYGVVMPTVEEIKIRKLYGSMILLLKNQGEEEITMCKEILFDFYSQHYKIEYLIKAIINCLREDYELGLDFYREIGKIEVRNNKGNRYFIHMECFLFYILREIVLGKNLKRKSIISK